mgnify:CR=1 FL=1
MLEWVENKTEINLKTKWNAAVFYFKIIISF